MLETPPVGSAPRGPRWLVPAVMLALVGCAADPTATSLSHTQSAVSANAAVVISQVYGGGSNSERAVSERLHRAFQPNFQPGPGGWMVRSICKRHRDRAVFVQCNIAFRNNRARTLLSRARSRAARPARSCPPPDASGVINMSATPARSCWCRARPALPATAAPPPATHRTAPLIIDLVRLRIVLELLRRRGTNRDAQQHHRGPARGGRLHRHATTTPPTSPSDAPTPRNSAGAANTCNARRRCARRGQRRAQPTAAATSIRDRSSASTFSEPVDGHADGVLAGLRRPVLADRERRPDDVHPHAGGGACRPAPPATSPSPLRASATSTPPTRPITPPPTSRSPSPCRRTPPTPIHTVQGAAHLSPLAGQVLNVGPAVVTAVASNGFYMQDPSPDGDDATSEGIFVFTQRHADSRRRATSW